MHRRFRREAAGALGVLGVVAVVTLAGCGARERAAAPPASPGSATAQVLSAVTAGESAASTGEALSAQDD